jgi:integrase
MAGAIGRHGALASACPRVTRDPLRRRLQEAQYLEVSDIDSQRMMIHVHRGKGAKDRFVPLPRATLTILRNHWRSHRHPRLLFPACGRDGRSAATATTPMAKRQASYCSSFLSARCTLRIASAVTEAFAGMGAR